MQREQNVFQISMNKDRLCACWGGDYVGVNSLDKKLKTNKNMEIWQRLESLCVLSETRSACMSD